MICKILRIKETSVTSERGGGPIDVHHWQALLRSISGYEPYRRAYDARTVPSQVLEFALKRADFPRSLSGCLSEMRMAIALPSTSDGLSTELDLRVVRLLETLRWTQIEDLLERGSISMFLEETECAFDEIEEATRLRFVATVPATRSIGIELVSMHSSIQQ